MKRDILDTTEADIARLVVAELQRQGFATYEEVSAGYASQRADVVGVRGPLVIVVETKTTVSLALLNQLLNWRGRAHWIIGATGAGKLGGAVHRFCKSEGFGLWNVSKFDEWTQEVVAPRLHRKADTKWLRDRCIPETATGSEYAAAGSRAGGYYTPFRRTAKDLADVVRQTPGIALRDALAALTHGHHYSSDKVARSSMPGCIEKGIVPGVRLEREGRALKLYPTEASR